MLSKPDIRKTMLAKRREMSASERLAACGYVCDQLVGITLPETAVVAGYMAISGEVDIAQALNLYHTRNNRVCLPIVTKPEKTLVFRRWVPGAAMRQGEHGIPEPDGGEVLVPDVILVPLVAFDAQGYRVGYGAGHYDATIATLKVSNPALRAIGIAYDFQQVEAVPHESHDMKLDMVVTDKGIVGL